MLLVHSGAISLHDSRKSQQKLLGGAAKAIVRTQVITTAGQGPAVAIALNAGLSTRTSCTPSPLNRAK